MTLGDELWKCQREIEELSNIVMEAWLVTLITFDWEMEIEILCSMQFANA